MDKDINAVQYDDLRKKGYLLQATQKLKAPSMTLNARSIDATRMAIIHSIEEIRKKTIRADTKKAFRRIVDSLIWLFETGHTCVIIHIYNSYNIELVVKEQISYI